MKTNLKIWLADLTYVQQTVASDVVPAAIANIGAYVQQELPGTDIKIFKLPTVLSKAFEKDEPHVIGFSTYCWNADISYQCARVIRKRYPKVVIVFGGPHFPVDVEGQQTYLRDRPEVDFYIQKEGEGAFLALIKKLIDNNWDKTADYLDVNNILYIDSFQMLQRSPRIERQMDLTKFPSPYLTGLLDEFLDGRYVPIIQSNRGCPFSCTFCSEGQGFWSKVRPKKMELIRDELFYVAEKMASIPAAKRRYDLMIADSNFGMFPQDIAIARWIGKIQDTYKYPTYLNVTTGKNRKERVLEAAKLVNNAMRLTGSVQSLDPGVLRIIKRDNISENKLMGAALEASEAGTASYSETILALPGDSKEKHFMTLEKLVNAGFNSISMHQLMMLSETDLGSQQTRQKYDLKTRFRILPRCFGYYDFLGESISCAEIEEVGVGNNTMTFDDYIECRKMDVITAIFLNGDVFKDVLKLLRLLEIPRWEFFRNIYENNYSEKFNELMASFLKEIKQEGHTDRSELERSIRDPKVIDEYIAGQRGNNVNFKYRALSLTAYFDSTLAVAKQSLEDVFKKYNVVGDERAFGREVIDFSGLCVQNIFVEKPKKYEKTFAFDVIRFSDPKVKPSQVRYYKLPFSKTLQLTHTANQLQDIQGFLNYFGSNESGITRILSRANIRHFFRIPQWRRQTATSGVAISP